MGDTAVKGLIPTFPAGDQTRAPADLGFIEAFLNTVDLESGGEEFDTPEALAEWLGRHGLLTDAASLTEADRRRALAVREALREMLLANHDGIDAPQAALELLQGESAGLPLTIDLSSDHAHLRPAGTGLDRAVGAMLAIVFHAMHDGTWSRMKACRNDTCHWAFYDASRNRSGKWCSMAICGNRTKVANYRERQS